MTTPTRLIPVPEWPNHHAWPSAGGLRHLIFNSQENGFEMVVRRLGRRVLIDEAAFFVWAEKAAKPKKNTRRRAVKAEAA